LVSIQYWSSNRSANVRKADQTTLSDGGRDRINAELARLRKRREHLLTGLVSDEDTVGNSGDAADEIQQAEDVAFVDKQIAKLEGLLHGSGSANTPTGLLPDGAQVTLRLADGENSCASAKTGTPSLPMRTTATLIGCLMSVTMTCFCQPGFSYQDNSFKPLASAIKSGLPS